MDILFLALDIDLRASRGDTIHTVSIAGSLARAGNRVHLVAGLDGHAELLPGVEMTVRPPGGDFVVLSHVREVVRSFCPDVIYERRFSPKIGWAASRAAGIPFVVEYNGIVDEEMAMQGRPLRNTLPNRVKASLRSQMLRRAGAVVTVTRGLRDIVIQRFGVAPEKVFVAENGVDPQLFRPLDLSESRSRLGLPEAPLVCYVGNLVRWQGLDTLVDATAALPSPVRLLLVGDGPSREHLMSHIERLNLGTRVRFTGTIPHGEVPLHIAAADVCVAPFSSERNVNSGVSALKVMEYVACGRPIVVTDVPGPRDIVEAYGCGVVVPPGDSKALAGGLERAIKEPAYKVAAIRASEVVRREHSWDHTASIVLGVLENVVRA